MNKVFSTFLYIILAAGILSNAYFMFTDGEPDKLWWWLLGIVFFLWTSVPFVGLAAAYYRITLNIFGKIVLFFSALIITTGGIYFLVEAFITHLDPQSGLIFIFLPFYQLVVVAIGIGVSLLLKILVKN